MTDNTSAKITPQSAVSHLYHFCDKLPHVSFTTFAPIFTFGNLAGSFGASKLVVCRITLPNALVSSIRTYQSRDAWKSEKMARMDAAFEAYSGLRGAGLINDNLLPEPQIDEEAHRTYREVMKRPSLVRVSDQVNPLQTLASLWQTLATTAWHTPLRFATSNGTVLDMIMITPRTMPAVPDLVLHLDGTTTLSFGQPETVEVTAAVLDTLNTSTHMMLSAVHGTRMRQAGSGHFPVLFAPSQTGDLTAWVEAVSGQYPASDLTSLHNTAPHIGVIRTNDGRRYTHHGTELRIQEDSLETPRPEPTVHLKCRLFPKQLDFTQCLAAASTTFEYLLPETCRVDRLPLQYATFARLIPSILHHLSHVLLAESLRSSLLSSIHFNGIRGLLTALTASSANERHNYQRFEFLGDACLKVTASATIMAQHPKWHEGYMSASKGHLVSNGRLALAAQELGLDKYIITKQFTVNKWRPPYNDDLLKVDEAGFRELSTKTLADVIEAIIGVAFVEGGIPNALFVLRVFLPEVEWQPLDQLNTTLVTLAVSAARSVHASSSPIVRLETLLEYRFQNKALLLEAITHPSHTLSTVPSYQRLEFLGDAVLDYIVTKLIFDHPKEIPVYRMHRLRTATVNAGFLSYCALSASVDVTTTIPVPSTISSASHIPAFEQITKSLNLPSFLIKAHIPDLTAALAGTSHRFTLLQPILATSLSTNSNTSYPWRALAAFAPEKTVSDLVESVIGACYIDSGGSFEVVEAMTRKLGLLQWLENAIEQDVKCWHPKEEVGTFGGESGVHYVVWRGSGLEPDDVQTKEVLVEAADMMGNDHAELNSSSDRKSRQVIYGEGSFHCKIIVNGEHVCTSHGWNRLEVETAAAEEAVDILQERGVLATPEPGTAVDRTADVEHTATMSDERMDLDESQDQDMDIQEDGGVSLVTHEGDTHEADEPGPGSESSTESVVFSVRKRRRAHSDHGDYNFERRA